MVSFEEYKKLRQQGVPMEQAFVGETAGGSDPQSKLEKAKQIYQSTSPQTSYATPPTQVEQPQEKSSDFWSNPVTATKSIGKFLTSSEQELGRQMSVAWGANPEKEVLDMTKSVNELVELAQKTPDIEKKRALLKQAQQMSQSAVNLADERLNQIPTKKQVIGAVGGVGLDVVTAGTYGNAAKGLKAGQLVFKAPTAVSKVVQGADKGLGLTRGVYQGVKAGVKAGAPVGAAYGVVGGLQNNEDLGGITKSAGMGALTGGLLAGALGGIGGGISGRSLDKRTQLAANKRTEELSKLEANYTKLGAVSSQAKARGLDPAKILGETNYLTGMVDKNGHITTKQVGGAVERFTDDVIKPGEDVVYKLLQKEGATIPLTQAQTFLKQKVMASGLEGGALTRALKNVEDDLAGYALKADKEGNISVGLLHNAKIDKTLNLNYLNPESKRIDKIIGNGLKELIEKSSSVEVKKLNTELSKYYTLLNYIKNLHGKKVAGGKLGKYFSQTIGAVVGSHFGPLGAIAGAEAGGQIRGQMMASKFGSPLGGKMKQSQFMQEAITAGNKPKASPLMLGAGTPGAPKSQVFNQNVISLPQNISKTNLGLDEVANMKNSYSKSLGNRKTTQSTTNAKTNSPINKSIPRTETVVNGILKPKNWDMMGLKDRISYLAQYLTGDAKKKMKQVIKNYESPDGLQPGDVNFLHSYGLKV